jgi:hypothetical protein
MADSLPPLNHDLSPYTGWTRAHWEAILARMTYGYVRAAEVSGSPARALYPDDRRGLPDAVDAIESFARMASAWGAWLSNPANPATVQFQGRSMDVEALVRQALLDGTNPANLRTYWGDITHLDQRIVEAADIAVTVWLSRERIFNRLTESERSQITAWLAQVDGKGTYPDNWILFSAMAQAVRLHLGYPAPEDDLDSRLDQLADFYRGDGWYVDGPGDEFELYNAWMFSWHFPLWALIDGDRRPDHRRRVLDRARSFIAGFPYFFGANGSYPAWGRSIVYRFAALAGFQTGHLLKFAPADPGLLRRVSSGCIRYFYEHGFFDPERHFVRQGFHGDFPLAGEAYISPGSPYWCCHGLFALAFPADDLFWTAVESPLPVERGDFDLTLPAPGFAVSGRKATGQVLLLNSRSGQPYDAPRHNYTSKYGKLVYSTHFPFNVVPVKDTYAPDAMVSLTRDGKSFGHRLYTRAGGAGPGFIWSKFEQILGGEPQPMWTAVLLNSDVQIRLNHIRPTYPVRAFEAPGALGCDRPTEIIRRSNPPAGWEYAEVEGRAVGIRRLLGYDSQNLSAPFLDQSNINLAYSYAEQPTVCESQPSVAARSLAALSLVRPASFDPAKELAGIEVATEGLAGFRLTLPDGAAAFVALGDVPPGATTLHGIAVEGEGMRYARLAQDHHDLCGLGVTQVAGIVAFSTPATFHLRRNADGSVHLTTNVAASPVTGWLGGPIRRVEVLALNGEWKDVTQHCEGNAIPAKLVREWSGRNERTLVEFRVNG